MQLSLSKDQSREKEFSPNLFVVAPGVWRLKDIFVNVYFVQKDSSTEWVLIDTGIVTSAPKIRKAIGELFGAHSHPSCIVLTHGHFDHRGSLPVLSKTWNVPVYVHPLEAPYLTGRSSYPPPDPLSGRGGMAWSSWMFPASPINVGRHLHMLPADGSIPCLPDWKWYHTPGHAPGHISLFRESDRVLIAGDAIITTNQDSVFAVATQKREMHGPPVYFTPDWEAAARSVRLLASLKPDVIATGHGRSLYGLSAQARLSRMANYFWQTEVPSDGRYVRKAAIMDEDGVEYLPPRIIHRKAYVIVGLLLAAATLSMAIKRKKRKIPIV